MLDKRILIGGFCFNQNPLNCLSKLNLNFIDINLFTSPFSLDDIASHVIQQFNADKNNILFGYSTGALVAIRVGLLKPELVKQIVLINSTPRFIREDNWGGIKSEDFNNMLFKLNSLDLTDFMSYFVTLAAYPKRITKNSHIFSNTNKKTLLNLMNILNTTDLRSQLLYLKDKVTLINSADDILVAKNLLAVEQIYLPDSTHVKLNEEYLLKVINEILCSKS